jgi:serine/threonine protein kinase
MTPNPAPLVSPIPSLNVRAVLDQDALVTAGLAVSDDGERAVLLVGCDAAAPGGRREFLAWGQALADVGLVAPAARVVGFGHTPDGRPFFASAVTPSLADGMRQVGPPPHSKVRVIATAVADVLAAAHANGIVHAAVSPATILIDAGQSRLGGFGAAAPGLDAPLGVWAFTAPEHREVAAAGGIVGTPAGDVFSLAATICVARAGMLPWSDPVSWADAAGLPSGGRLPGWVEVIRAALAANPDQRPTAEEFAAGMRDGDDPAADPAVPTRVDLRGLIPREVRRLAAYSVDAMNDGSTVVARATPPPTINRRRSSDGRVVDLSPDSTVTFSRIVAPAFADAPTTLLPLVPAGAPVHSTDDPRAGMPDRENSGTPTPADNASEHPAHDAATDLDADEPDDANERPTGFSQALLTKPAAVAIAATASALLLGTGAYAWAQQKPPPAAVGAPAAATPSPRPTASSTLSPAQLLAGARQAGQQFIHNIGVQSDVSCVGVITGNVVTTTAGRAPISCAALLADAKSLLGSDTLDTMSNARVTAAVGYAGGSVSPSSGRPYPQAQISLPYVPALRTAVKSFEMVLTFRGGQWWVAQVTFG